MTWKDPFLINHKSHPSTSKNLDELVIVLMDDQTSANQKNDGHSPTEDDADINIDDTNVSDPASIFNSSAT